MSTDGPRVLIVGGGLFQLDVIQAARDLGAQVAVVDRDAAAPGMALADHPLPIDTSDTAAVLDAARRLAIDGVTTAASDVAVAAVARVVDALGLPGAGQAVAERATDKLETARCLLDAGLSTPPTQAVRDLSEARQAISRVGGYPIVIKPRSSAGGRGVTVVQGEGALSAALERAARYGEGPQRVLVQGFAQGVSVGVEAFFWQGELIAFFAMDDQYQEGFVSPVGHSIPCTLAPDALAGVRAEVAAFGRAIGIESGPANFDLRLEAGTTTLIEVNLRLGGNSITELVRLAHGVDLSRATVTAALGRSPAALLDVQRQRASAVRLILKRGRGRASFRGDPAAACAADDVERVDVSVEDGVEATMRVDDWTLLGRCITKGASAEARAAEVALAVASAIEVRASSERLRTPEQVGAYWDSQVESVAADAELAELGTVTGQRAVVAYRDALERAHLARVLRIGPDSRVLDLGGGAGRIALWLAPQVAEVTLVDVSEGMLEAARGAAARAGVDNLDTACADVASFEPEGSYDAVLLMGVAMYMDEDAVARLAQRVTAALAPGGRLYAKEAVTTDGETRYDDASTTGVPYRAIFRPRERYAEIFGAYLRPVYQQATCAHFLPWFLGGTAGAAEATGEGLAGQVLRRLIPPLVAIDPVLQQLEDAFRATPGLDRMLADVPVLQDLYVFEKSAAAETLEREPGLSVVVIAYNEEACLLPVVRELTAALDASEVGSFELVLVDDGSSDGTLAQMRTLQGQDSRVQVVPLQPNRGIGGALRAGFDAARGHHVTWIPADGQIGPEVVLELHRLRERAPMITTVYRSRDDAWYRHVISGTLNRLIKAQTGQRAKSGGTYIFEREAWERFGPRDDDSMMISTQFRHKLRAAGQTIEEIEIDARARVAGHSKVLNPRTIARTLRSLLRS